MDLLDWYSIQKYIYAYDDLKTLREQYSRRKEEILSRAYPKWDTFIGGYYKDSTETIGLELAALSNTYEKQVKRITRNADIFHQALNKLDEEERHLIFGVLDNNNLLHYKRARNAISHLASVIQSIKDKHINEHKEQRKQKLLKQIALLAQ